MKHKTMTLFGWKDRDFVHHIALVCVLLTGVMLFVFVSYSRILQFLVAVGVAISYVIWGIVHHKLDHDFHMKSVIEYVLIALLSVLIVGTVLL